MSLDPGQRLGPYEVREQLGKGGMGEVYRARDTRLGREVAIKVLRSDRVVDEGRKSRFLREARAISTLNHPSIVTLHDIAADGGIDFIVMELVPGRSLDKLIPRGGLGLQETVRIALPIASALTSTHSAGIIHRDLKPANVMVTPEGQVKVLDFGLAKLTDSDDAVQEGPTLSDDSPPSISQPGAISGTPAYMSPEQAAGLPLDARSDIFSFGSLLYEMITGRSAFGGASKDETLAAVRGAEPSPPSEIVPGLPPELEKLILRCLRKDPGRRIQHMADVRVALEDVREESTSASSRIGPARMSRRPRAMTAAGLVVLGSLGVGLAAYWLQAGKTRASRRPLTRVTSDSGLTTDAAVSPAGNLLAYASDRAGEGHLDIWIQPLPQGEAIRLTRDPADESAPSFSPDGSRIAFRSAREGGGIYVISALGGRETRIADKGRGPRFSPDGQLIAYSVGDTVLSGGVVYVVPAAGGPARQVGEQALLARNPLWSPDGRHLLCIAFPDGQDTPIWIALPLDGGAPIRTGAEESLAKARFGAGSLNQGPEAWAPDGEHVLFSALSGDTTNIWEIGLSPRTWKATGPVRQVTFGTGVMRRAAVFKNQLLVTSATENVNLWQLTLDDKGENATEPVAVTTTPGRDHWPSLSADGRWVAYLSERSGVSGVWVTDLVNPRDIAVTLPPVTAAYPRIAADGSKVAYLVRDPPPSDGREPPTVGFLPAFQTGSLFSVGLGRNGDVGVPKRLCEGCGRIWDWSADGRYLVQRATDGVLLRDSSSGESLTLLPVPNAAFKSMPADPRFSPDGRWIAVTSILSPLTRQNFVAPFRGPVGIPDADWFPVTDGTTLDRQVAWSPRGDRLFFHSDRDGFLCLWAQRLDPVTKRAMGSPYPVHHFHNAGRSMTIGIRDPGAISVSAGGNRLVFTLGETAGNIWTMDY